MSGESNCWKKAGWLHILAAWLSAFTPLNVSTQPSPPAPRPRTYADLAAGALLKRAEQISRALNESGFIPAESYTNARVNLEGQSTHPSGNVLLSSCQYEFREGLVYAIRRKDLFEDKGPASLILNHLTNEALILDKDKATQRAFEVLHCLSYDPERIQATHRIHTQDDLLTAYPIRNGGPDFPKDLHFFGELISRKKIKMTVGLLPQIPPAEKDAVSAAEMRIDFLATTGELLEAWWLPDSSASKLLGIRCPDPITIPDTPDFAPPLFFSVNRTVPGTSSVVPPETAIALVNDAWNELQNKLATNKAKAVQVCDNLNQAAVVADALKRLAGGLPWVGVSHQFNLDLPFDSSLMQRLAKDKRGIALLAIAGGIEMQLELIPDLDTEAIDFEMEPQDAMQRRYNLLKDQFAPRVAALLLRLNLPETMPDHVLFLMEPAANPASSVIHSELETRLRRKAQVVSVMGAADGWSIGQGVTYFGGSVFSNAIAVVRLSGSLPLQPDHLTPMRLALARLSNAPPGLNLAELQSRPPLRILSGEAINPVRHLAFSFGPH